MKIGDSTKITQKDKTRMTLTQAKILVIFDPQPNLLLAVSVDLSNFL